MSFQKNRCKHLVGVGIDLVDLTRIQKFLKKNGNKAASRLLAESEKKSFQSSKNNPILFAKLFAAKEAYFKATGSSWMGLEGFQAIEVRCFPRDRFEVQSSILGPRKGKADGRFFRHQKLMGAQVILWS